MTITEFFSHLSILTQRLGDRALCDRAPSFVVISWFSGDTSVWSSKVVFSAKQ
jgi:hypothetical protein